MTDRTIYPTHHCFDDTCEYLERVARERPAVLRAATIRLVHGIVLTPDDQPAGHGLTPGTRHVHAWIEEDDLVTDFGLLADGRRVEYQVERAEYYAHHRVQETTVYTPQAVLINNVAFGHTGPWHGPYRALHAGMVLERQR